MTVEEAIQFAEGYLSQRKLSLPRQDAELLVSSILQKNRAFLYGHPECELRAAQERLFCLWLAKRGEHYPLQYLRGHQEFYGRDFIVRPGVFIPRPETEVLIEITLERLKQYPQKRLRIADVGTGSGCIAITLACEDPRVHIVATDASPTALEVARLNAKRHGCANRIKFCLKKGLGGDSTYKHFFDLILSNPPYVGRQQRHRVDLSVRKYEPSNAVFAGESGQEVYAMLLPQAMLALKSQGSLILELGEDSKKKVVALAQQTGWKIGQVRADLAGIDRCIALDKDLGQKGTGLIFSQDQNKNKSCYD